jgi:hypothetical protein
MRVDQLVLDELPNDPGHLVAVELDDRVGDLDLGHEHPSSGWGKGRVSDEPPAAEIRGSYSTAPLEQTTQMARGPPALIGSACPRSGTALFGRLFDMEEFSGKLNGLCALWNGLI